MSECRSAGVWRGGPEDVVKAYRQDHRRMPAA